MDTMERWILKIYKGGQAGKQVLTITTSGRMEKVSVENDYKWTCALRWEGKFGISQS